MDAHGSDQHYLYGAGVATPDPGEAPPMVVVEAVELKDLTLRFISPGKWHLLCL